MNKFFTNFAALGGALIESTKGFNLGEILFGKRGDMDFDTLIVDAVRLNIDCKTIAI